MHDLVPRLDRIDEAEVGARALCPSEGRRRRDVVCMSVFDICVCVITV